MANMFINAMTDLWNNVGTTYTAIKMNVTNAASSATSKLMDLQVGAVSKFSVDKNGAVVAASTISTTGALLPAVSDGAALGSTTFQWSDLYGATGFAINFGAGNWIGTHSTGILTIAPGDIQVTTAGTAATSVATLNGTQTLVNKSLTAPTITGAPTASAATWTNLGAVTTIDINGGTIDGAIIGGASAAAITGTVITANTSVVPDANDGAAIGTTTLGWSDIFLAATADVRFGNTDWVASHTTGILTVGTGDLRVTTAGTNAASVVTVGGTQTLTGKTLTSPTISGTISGGTFTTASLTSPTITGSPTASGATWASLGTVTTVTINGGAITGTTISGSTGSFTTLGASSTVSFSGGGSMTGTWTSLGTVTTIDINGGTVDGTIIGASSAAAATVTTLTASGAVALSPASANVVISPTVTGTVTINPATAGTINAMSIGATTRASGAFTTLAANSTVTFTAGGTFAGSTWTDLGIVTTVDINGGTIDGAVIGGSSAVAGTFSTLTGTTIVANTAANPDADAGATLGTSLLGWAALNLSSAATLTFGNTNWVATHASGNLTIGTGDLKITNNFTTATSVTTNSGAQTLANKTLTAPTINAATLTGTISGGTFTSTSLTSPTLTGIPIAPTAGSGTSTTQIATTAFVADAVATGGGSYQPLDATLTAWAAYGTVGFPALTAADTFAGRTITGTAAEITVTNGAGTAGNPTLSLPTALTFTGKTVTGGTFNAAHNGTVGATTPDTGSFTTLAASSTTTLSGAVSMSPSNLAVTISPTGTGTVAISPVGALTINPTAASTINNTSIGVTTRAAGAFTTLGANAAVTFSAGGTLTGTFTGGTLNATALSGPISGSTGSFTTLTASSTTTLSPAGANVVLSPTGAGVVTINPGTAGTIDKMVIGGTAAAAGTFTTSTATTVVVGGDVRPDGDGGADIGTTTLGWATLYMASLGNLRFGNTNWVATHTSGVLTVGTGDLRVTTAGTNSASVVTVGGTQTLTAKTLTSPTITGAALNGTLGATTPSTAVVTTLTVNSNATVTGTLLAGATTVANFTSNGIVDNGTTVDIAIAKIRPSVNDATALGDTTHMFSDLFLASGGVINWNNSNYTITHGSGALTFSGPTATVGTVTGVAQNPLAGNFADDGNLGPVITWFHDSASPAVNDSISLVRSYGRTSTAAQFVYVDELTTIVDPTNATATGSRTWRTAVNGVLTNQMMASASGMTIHNLLDLSTATAGQVKFPATQNASSNVNTLDDYEEGTFVPTIVGTSAAGAGTYTLQTGTYTKIGDRVLFTINLVWSAHTGTGNMNINGLPFTNSTNLAAVTLYLSSLTFTAGVQGVIASGATSITLTTAASAGLATALPIDTAASIYVTGHYSV